MSADRTGAREVRTWGNSTSKRARGVFALWPNALILGVSRHSPRRKVGAASRGRNLADPVRGHPSEVLVIAGVADRRRFAELFAPHVQLRLFRLSPPQ